MKRSFVFIKTAYISIGILCFIVIGSVFAKVNPPIPRIIELNSGNIVTTYGCSTWATLCDLRYRNITDIAPDAFINHTNLTTLLLQSNRIALLKSGAFNGLSHLNQLYLGMNKISSIENGAFFWLSGLTLLSLQYNQMVSLGNGSFLWLSGLNVLDLSYNRIVSLENGNFLWLPYLNQLILNGNQITSIESGDFSGAPRIRDLDIFKNQITSIESGDFSGLPILTQLYLWENQISSLENSDFFWLSLLNTLFFNANQISVLKSDTFNGLSGINHLDLSFNQIMSVKTGMFNGFSVLWYLYFSPSCNTDGYGNIPYYGWLAPTDSENCALISGTAVSNFIATLGSKGYGLNSGYYLGNYAISFNHPSSINKFLANVIMQSTNSNGYPQSYYNHVAQVQYDSWVTIHDGYHFTTGVVCCKPFTGVLYSPVLFAPQSVPGLSDVITLMRFWALIQRIEFNKPIIIRMPALGKNPWDTVSIYNSDEESIYGPNWPHRSFGKIVTVIERDGFPYVEFTTIHAGRYAIKDDTKNDIITAAEQPIIRIREGWWRWDIAPTTSTTSTTTVTTIDSTVDTKVNDIISSLSTELQWGTTSLLQTTLE